MKLIVGVTIVGVTSVALISFASVAAHAQPPVVTPTDVPRVAVVAAPPAGFNPLTASPAERAHYAVPPAPDPKIAPKAYAQWLRAMADFDHREPTTLVPTTNFAGPMRNLKTQPSGTAGLLYGTSSNWSGTSVVGETFAKVESIVGIFTVPAARQAMGACTGGWDYSVQWPGIDGNGSGDVLQGGTQVDSYCKSGSTSTFYTAWVEWFPYSWTNVGSPAISPGDQVYVQVWVTDPSNYCESGGTYYKGAVYLDDYSTGISATYCLDPPSGTTLVGNSVEWIVEDPSVSGSTGLTNYVEEAWQDGFAWAYANTEFPNYHFMGQIPAYLQLQDILMTDGEGNGISGVSIENGAYLDFETLGCVYNSANAC